MMLALLEPTAPPQTQPHKPAYNSQTSRGCQSPVKIGIRLGYCKNTRAWMGLASRSAFTRLGLHKPANTKPSHTEKSKTELPTEEHCL